MKNQRRVLGLWLAIFLIAQLPVWSQDKGSFPWFEKPRTAPVFPDLGLSIDRLAQALAADQVIPVDLRSAEAFRKGHIPGAVHLGLAQGTDPAALRSALEAKGLCGTKAVVLYDDNSNLSTLGSAFLSFEAAGHAKAQVLLGGYDAWTASGGAVEIRSPALSSCVFESPAGEVIVDRQWVADHFGQAGIEILDLRGPGGWESGNYDAPSLFSAGHIPHSLPLNLAALLGEKGAWPAPATARQLLVRLGPRPETFVNPDATFVLYGTGTDDPRPGLGYLLLRAMDMDVKVFAGGFQNWAEDKSSPIVRILSTAELKQSLRATGRRAASDPVVFDLREEWDFRDSHLPGAESLPSHKFAEQFATRISQALQPVDPSQTPLIFYCYGEDCIRSRECAKIAARHGFQNLVWYREGMEGWSREGGIVEGTGDAARSRVAADLYKSLEGSHQ